MAVACSPIPDKMAEGDLFKDDIMVKAEDRSHMRPRETLEKILVETAQQHFEKAKKCSAENAHDNAVVHLTKAIALVPDEISFYVARGDCYLRLCDIQSAILNYRKACLVQPGPYVHRLAFLYYMNAEFYLEQKMYVEALENFTQASEIQPDSAGYRIRSVACLSALGYHENCLSIISETINQLRLQSNNRRTFHKAKEFVSKPKSVDSDVPAECDAQPSIADLLVLRARVYKNMSRTSECYSDLIAALSMDPTHSEAVALKASLNSTADQLKQEAVRLVLQGQHRDAIIRLSAAITTNPLVPDLHILRGAVCRQLGDFNSAIDDYLMAMSKAGNDTETEAYKSARHQLLLTYNDFAIECLSKQFFDEALLLLNKAIKEEKTEKGLYFNRGECFFQQGEMDFALADYMQALELDPCDVAVQKRISEIHEECANQLFSDGNYEEAKKSLDTALEYNPSNLSCYILRSKVHELGKDLNGARRDVVAALLLDRGNPAVISVITRLFPGKTLSDILGSQLASDVKTCVLRKPLTQPGKSSVSKVKSNSTAAKLNSQNDDRVFHAELAKEKRQIDKSVKDVLRTNSCVPQPVNTAQSVTT